MHRYVFLNEGPWERLRRKSRKKNDTYTAGPDALRGSKIFWVIVIMQMIIVDKLLETIEEWDRYYPSF